MAQLMQGLLWENAPRAFVSTVSVQRGKAKSKTRVRDRIVSAEELCMLEALHHLRYVSIEQIRSSWYPDRTLNGCAVRVSRLLHSGFLQATRYAHPGSRAYSLGLEGYRKLRYFRGLDLNPLPKLHVLTVPHQLDTNEVFAILANGSCLPWADMPFRWRGSHEVSISYEDTRLDEDGIPRRRSTTLRPDAAVTYAEVGLRCFLELDRSTECLREADDRRSLRGKLKAYRAALCKGPIGSKTTWYGAAFKDDRPPCVVFVLARSHALPRVATQRHQRMNAIRAAAKELASNVDVRVVYLDDGKGVREAFGFPPASIDGHRDISSVRLSEIQRLEKFCRLAKKSSLDGASASVNRAAREALAALEKMGVGV